MNYKEFIFKHGINKSLLARKMNMPLGTFANKISNSELYKFDVAELDRLKVIMDGIIKDYADIEFHFKPTMQQLSELSKLVNNIQSEKITVALPYSPLNNPRFKSKNKIK